MAALSDVEQKSLALKDEGNSLLKDGKYGQAAEKYTQAIEVMPTAVLYSNRAQAMIKLESYGLAISDADKAIGYVLRAQERNSNDEFILYGSIGLNTKCAIVHSLMSPLHLSYVCPPLSYFFVGGCLVSLSLSSF